MYDQENSNQEFGGAASGPENGGQMSGSEANNAGSGSTYNENCAASDSAAESVSVCEGNRDQITKCVGLR